MRSTINRLLPIVVTSILLGCGSDSPVAPSPSSCRYSLTPSSTAFEASGGSGTVTIAAEAGCVWTARADASWLSITDGAGGSGDGTVRFTVAVNSDAASRESTLTIAGQQVTLRQDGATGPCTYSLAPASASFGSVGGTGTFSVATGASCAWTAVSSASWLVVTAGREGTGNGAVAYSVAEHNDPRDRTATITAGDQVFRVTQSGEQFVCEYSVSPIEFHPCMASTELVSQVVTQSGCAWTAAVDVPWLSVTAGASGAGSGAIRFRVTDNYDAPRIGIVMVRWPTPTAGQNLRISQAGCRYAVSRDAFSFTADSGTGTFDVVQQSEPYTCGGPTQNACVWTARSDSGWITVTSSMPRAGDDRVSFSIAANGSAASRTGTITVRDHVVRITQAGR